MSSELVPINIQSRLNAVQDALQQRKMAQNQMAAKPMKQEQAKLNSIPDDDLINQRVNDTLFNIKKGVNPDRGSILNILA